MDKKQLTGVRKRQQIVSANKQMMIWVAAAAAVVTVCAMLAINFTQRIMYNIKVNTAKGETEKTLKENIETIPKLMSTVNALQTNKNLLALRADSNDTAFNVVLDALPTEDDRAALGSSIQEKIFSQSGASLNSFNPSASGDVSQTSTQSTATSGEVDVSSTVKPVAQPISFSFAVTGNYESLQKALLGIERTIRPIIITEITIKGSDTELKAEIVATTYYVPNANYTLGKKPIYPDGYDKEKANADKKKEATK